MSPAWYHRAIWGLPVNLVTLLMVYAPALFTVFYSRELIGFCSAETDRPTSSFIKF